MEVFFNVTKYLLEGFGQTCLLFILTLLFALPLGLLISFGTMAKFRPLRWLMKTIVWIVRGIPLMLQLFIIFYAPGMLFDLRIPSMTVFSIYLPGYFIAALIAFVINYACYFSEIYRGGIESISRGQYEAGQVLGMTKSQIFFKVVLKQVIKRIIPPMSNEIITLVKDTALARVIGVKEIIDKSYILLGPNGIVAGGGLIWPIFYAGVFYLIFVGGLTLLFNHFEKKLSYFKA